MHSLNVAAKDFIPSNDKDRPASGGFYRYSVKYEIPRETLTTTFLTSVDGFLSGKTLVSEIPFPVDCDASLEFSMSSFQSICHNEDRRLRGFFLSSENLQIPEVSSSYTKACGVLVPLGVDGRCSVFAFLYETWRKFFSSFREADNITGLGYIRHNVSASMLADKVADKHFFYVTCSPNTEADVLVNINTFTKLSKMSFEKIFIVKSILPFLFSPQAPLCVVATVGEQQYDSIVNMYQRVDFRPSSLLKTYESLKIMEEHFMECLQNGCVSTTKFVFYIHVHVASTSKGYQEISIDDIIRFIGNMCNRTFSYFCGVSFENPPIVSGAEKLLLLNGNESFYHLRPLTSLLYALPINMFAVTLGEIPGWITVPLETEDIEKGIEAYSKYVGEGKVKGQEENFLTSAFICDAATNLATKKFEVCKRAVGRKILVGTLPENKLFGIDVKKGSIFGLPFCFAGCSSVCPECIFVATLASVEYDIGEFRIVIEDILQYCGSDISNYSFLDRWEHVKEIEMDPYSWPHSSPLHIVILRSRYEPLHMLEIFMKTRECYCSLGLQLKCLNEAHTTYSWVPSTSITAKFSAGAIIKNDDCMRISLHCYDCNKTLMPYYDEYTECSLESFPNITVNDTIECLLRTGEDGSHWWDLINVLDSKDDVFSEKEVYDMVHYRGLSESELLKLIEAPKYICVNCKKVNTAVHLNDGQSMCLECWRAAGYGACAGCSCSFSSGSVDRISNHFYCNACKKIFSRTNSRAELGYHVPPPPSATFTQQVTSRCISILIDSVNPRGPTNDVLELCCGGAVPRKWIKNKTMEYLGVDSNENAIIAQKEAVNRSFDLPKGCSYKFFSADAFSKQFWEKELAPRHPAQFQTITCFSGFHHAFDEEEKCRSFIARVSNALVPGGLFIGIFIDAIEMFQKGKKFNNKAFSVEWDEDALPRPGNSFTLSRDGEAGKKVNVIPTDFLVAVGESFNLKPISDLWKSFQEIIESDPKWTKPPSDDVRAYLRVLRVFAFKKRSDLTLPQ